MLLQVTKHQLEIKAVPNEYRSDMKDKMMSNKKSYKSKCTRVAMEKYEKKKSKNKAPNKIQQDTGIDFTWYVRGFVRATKVNNDEIEKIKAELTARNVDFVPPKKGTGIKKLRELLMKHELNRADLKDMKTEEERDKHFKPVIPDTQAMYKQYMLLNKFAGYH